MWVSELKHVIIGAGVVGSATGIWLEANKHAVYYYDINNEVISKLEKEGRLVIRKEDLVVEINRYDVFWICTHEKDVEHILSNYKMFFPKKIVIVRSTCPPGTMQYLKKKYNLERLAHNPEFLREKTAIDDEFNQDRIIVGVENQSTRSLMKNIYGSSNVPVFFVDFTTSELIKYASNCWLTTQISYWNEIKKICDKFDVNPQTVANGCTLDKRISKYGTAMLGEPFGGFCLPKDLDALIKSFEGSGLDSVLLKAVRKVNERIKKEKKGKMD